MKRVFLFLLGGLMLSACNLFDIVPLNSKDSDLPGQKVDAAEIDTRAVKLFVLNEGGMGSNNSTLDFLRFKDGTYVNGAFRQMNPDVRGSLGDVGNDIAINRDEVWMAITNSGVVEVVSARDETEIAAITIPTPRNIAFDNRYAYVTSWAGAFASGSYDSNGNYVVTDSKNPKGQVYRIDLSTKKVDGTVEVGYQPEGIAYYDDKLYVANSGGISSQLPPNYAYDNTLSIIDTKTFKVTQTVEVEVNLKDVYADGRGMIYITTLGNYWSIHSGLFLMKAANPSQVQRFQIEEDIDLGVTCSAMVDGTIYFIGTSDEFNWGITHTYALWSIRIDDMNSGNGSMFLYPIPFTGTPYGLTVLDGKYLFVGDAGDYFNPGTVTCYALDTMSSLDTGFKLWSVTSGVCPGHFALYK